jgi:hypothetical protein
MLQVALRQKRQHFWVEVTPAEVSVCGQAGEYGYEPKGVQTEAGLLELVS